MSLAKPSDGLRRSLRRRRNDGQSDQDSADLLHLVEGIWRRKWLVLLSTILLTGLFYGIASQQPPGYSARATVMLDVREQRVIANQEQVVGNLPLTTPLIESEVALLRSARLLEAVILEIGIDRFDVLDPALASPTLMDKAQDWVRDQIKSALSGNANDQGSDEITAAPVSDLISPERRRMLRIIGALREGTAVRRVGDSFVIEVIVETVDAELTALVANTMSETYIDSQLQERRRLAESATRWLSDQVDRLRSELLAAEAELTVQKRDQAKLIGLGEEVLRDRLVNLNQREVLVAADRLEQETRLRRLTELVETVGIAAASRSLSTPFVLALREDREQLFREQTRLELSLGTEHPDRKAIQQELSQIDLAIAQEVRNATDSYENEINILMAQEAAFAAEAAALQTQIIEVSETSLSLLQLEREVEAARTSYEALLARLGEIRAQVEIQRAEAKVLNNAQIPPGASTPRTKLWSIFGATVGLSLGLLVALLMELTSTTFRSESALEGATGLNVLAKVPYHRLSRPMDVLRYLARQPYSSLAEQMRQIRTVLAASGTGDPICVLLLSSQPGEGKTTTTLALAHMFARAKQSTILVDLDTRRSDIASEIEKSNTHDLSDHIINDVPLEQAIYRLEDYGFDVAVTGNRRAIMADDVSVEKLRDLIAKLKTKYDVVVVDAPPVLNVSDGLAIASVADRILFLVRWGATKQKAVLQALSALDRVKAKPSEILITMSPHQAETYRYTPQ